MNKLLEDIRRRHGERNKNKGDNSTQPTNRPASDHVPQEKDSSSVFQDSSNVITSPQASSYPKCVCQPSANFSAVEFSSSVVANDLGLLYLNETVNLGRIFPKPPHDFASDEDPLTGTFQDVKMLTSPLSNGASNLNASLNGSDQGAAATIKRQTANENPESMILGAPENFQKLMFSEFDQLVKAGVESHATNPKAVGGNSRDVLENSIGGTHSMVASSLPDGLITSEVVRRSDEIDRKLSLNLDEGKLSHGENEDIETPHSNNGFPMNLGGDSCGIVNSLALTTSSRDKRIPSSQQKSLTSAQYNMSALHLHCEDKKAVSYENISASIVKTCEKECSFDSDHRVEEPDIRKLTTSSSIREIDVKVDLDSMRGTKEGAKHTIPSKGQNGKPENLPIDAHPTREMSTDVAYDLYENTSEQTLEAISYCGFMPSIQSTFSSPESVQASLRLPIIPKDSQASDVVHPDVLVSTGELVEISNGVPVADSNAKNPDKTSGCKSVQKNSTVSGITKSNKSTHFDCNGNMSQCSNPLATHDTFFKALPALEQLAEPRNTALSLYGRCVIEPEICDFPVPNDYIEHKWIPKKISRMVLGTSGCCYEGEIYNNKMHGHGRFYFAKDQYIEGKWEMNSLVEPNLSILTIESISGAISVLKMLNFYLVTIPEFDFVAKATTNSFKELDFKASVADVKASFFGKFKMEEILNDEMRSKRDLFLKEFKVALKLVTTDADFVKNATILFLLSNYAESFDTEGVLHAIQTSDVFPPTLRNAATNLMDNESKFKLRNQVINSFSNIVELVPQMDIRELTFNKYVDQVTEHRRSLLAKCPTNFPNLMETIQKLPGEKILYVTREDVGVFHHLLSLPHASHDQTYEYIQNLFGGFLEEFVGRLQSITRGTLPCVVIPLISQVFGYLYKSFSEIVVEIVDIVGDSSFQDMLCMELKVEIRWPVDGETNLQGSSYPEMSKQKSIWHRKSLQAQYHATHQMLMFFSPANYLKGRVFPYNFCVLKFDLSWWLRAPNTDVSVLPALAEQKSLSNERLAWLYILDYTVHQLLRDNPQALKFIKMYHSLLQGYISFVQKSVADTHESFRVLIHSIINFLVCSAPYFTGTIEKQGLDFEVLSYQMRSLTTAARELDLGPAAFTNFRDLIEEYKRYWTHQPFMDIRKIRQSPGYFTNQICALMQQLGEAVRISFAKEVPIICLVRYMRSMNDFMADFKNIDFFNCWYVKSDAYYDGVMDKILNKISSTKHCSYRVTNIDGFIKFMEGNPIPNHCIITVVARLIECVNYFLNRSWRENNRSEQTFNMERLESTGMLLDAIRQSLMYLKEQPEYIDFETFVKESTEPFMRIVYESKDLDEVKNRTSTAKESFWYIRNMDTIGIKEAITLFASINDCTISGNLSDGYDLYLKQYNSYMETYCRHLRDGLGYVECLAAVRQAIKMVEPIHFSKWSEHFKTKEIPKLLAGLSAVWSILVSKDVSSTGKFLKPHCIQILCVLRLLNIDKPKGAENHLAQVLTGQGKSLILGLLSSVLALSGHKVRVMCYSDYLSTRDENDFKEFFQQFNIADSIDYGTFQDMANGFLKPLCNGKRTNLRKMVCERVLYHRDWASFGSVKTESSDTVLLIDEVDVFFNERFYSNVYDSLTTVKIPGLANIQYTMWKIAQGSGYSAVQVKRLTEKHVSEQINLGVPLYQEWEEFCRKPGMFQLLVDDVNGKSEIKKYTNRSLADEHLLKMAEDALLLSCSNEMDHLFKLNEEGLICMRNSAGQYLPGVIESYRNTFAYFKIKGSDVLSLDHRNLGYLVLKTGKISYGRLPCQFPLILGVSGTLDNLSEHEKIGIDSYNIKQFSILPSFFGDSSLKFNTVSDFTYIHEQQDWLNRIYHKANEMVQSLRAVLIFFDSDIRLNLFAENYRTKFDRVNEITLNTLSHLRDLYINEAGISCTVTLATRTMGRGLDYKSSLAVEKRGGIHIIQTFFSVDIKEEIQIRGRTARKDNKGSYELIICKEHLLQKKIIHNDTEHTYSSLQLIRKRLMEKVGKRHFEMIMKSEHDHEITMMYYGLSQFNRTTTEPIVLND